MQADSHLLLFQGSTRPHHQYAQYISKVCKWPGTMMQGERLPMNTRDNYIKVLSVPADIHDGKPLMYFLNHSAGEHVPIYVGKKIAVVSWRWIRCHDSKHAGGMYATCGSLEAVWYGRKFVIFVLLPQPLLPVDKVIMLSIFWPECKNWHLYDLR